MEIEVGHVYQPTQKLAQNDPGQSEQIFINFTLPN